MEYAGSVIRYKARLVAKDYSQLQGIDFVDTYAPVACMTTVRVVLAIAMELSSEVFQDNVETAYLNGVLREEVYVESPPGREHASGIVLKLNKALYGLKQAAAVWKNTLTAALEDLDVMQL